MKPPPNFKSGITLGEIKTIVSKYLSKADKVSDLDLASSFTNLRKAVEAVVEHLYAELPKEFISVMKKLKNMRDAEIITASVCKELIKIVSECNKHCHHNPNSDPIENVFNETKSKFSDIYFTIFDDYVGISDDTDVSLLNQKSIRETAAVISANDGINFSGIDDDLLLDVMSQSEVCKSEHDYESAERFAKFCLEGFKISKNEINYCRCLLLLSDIYEGQNKLQESTAFAQEGLSCARELSLYREEGWGLHNLGIIHEKIGDYNRSRYFLEKALQAHLRSDYDKVDIAKIQNSLAMSYLDHVESRDLEKAQNLLTDASKNLEGKILPQLNGSIHACFSFIEEKRGNYSAALELAHKAREMYSFGGVHPSLLKRLKRKIKTLRKLVKKES